MGLDIRLPIGLMFSIIGVVLAAYGVISPTKSQALGMNANLIWGACILGFGGAMMIAWNHGRTPAKSTKSTKSRPAKKKRKR